MASPSLYAGQMVRAGLKADAANNRAVTCRLYASRQLEFALDAAARKWRIARHGTGSRAGARDAGRRGRPAPSVGCAGPSWPTAMGALRRAWWSMRSCCTIARKGRRHPSSKWRRPGCMIGAGPLLRLLSRLPPR